MSQATPPASSVNAPSSWASKAASRTGLNPGPGFQPEGDQMAAEDERPRRGAAPARGRAALARSRCDQRQGLGRSRGGRPCESAVITSARSSIVAGASFRASRRTCVSEKSPCCAVMVGEVVDDERRTGGVELERRADAAQEGFRERPARRLVARADPAHRRRAARRASVVAGLPKSWASTAKSSSRRRAGSARPASSSSRTSASRQCCGVGEHVALRDATRVPAACRAAPRFPGNARASRFPPAPRGRARA